MKLQEAIKSIIELKSTSILNNVLVLNILSDYNAFEEIPSSKNVLKKIFQVSLKINSKLVLWFIG